MNLEITCMDARDILRLSDLDDFKIPESVDLVLFPECFTTGYDLKLIAGADHKTIDPIIQKFTALSNTTSAKLIFGSPYFHNGKKVNTVLCSSQGVTELLYAKNNLISVPGLDEQPVFAPGTGITCIPFELKGTRFGFGICYDLRFPEHFGRISSKGAAVFFVPAAWPRSRISHWKALLAARAIENQAYFIGLNYNSDRFGDGAMVFSPMGELLEPEPKPGSEGFFTSFSLDISKVNEYRSGFQSLSDRKKRYYP